MTNRKVRAEQRRIAFGMGRNRSKPVGLGCGRGIEEAYLNGLYRAGRYRVTTTVSVAAPMPNATARATGTLPGPNDITVEAMP